MRTVKAVRLLGATAIIIALAATTYAAMRDGVFVLWNFFGFFTIQSNVIGIAALLIAVRFTGVARPRWVELARACATVYLVIVGIVYWTLLVGVDVQIAYPWANVILHGVASVLLLADWLIEGPERPFRGALRGSCSSTRSCGSSWSSCAGRPTAGSPTRSSIRIMGM